MTSKTFFALAAAALAVSTAISTGAEARGFGGGGFGGGRMMGGGGGVFRSAPAMKMSTFKSSSFKASNFKSSPKVFKSKPAVVKHTFKPAKTFVHKETKTFKNVAKTLKHDKPKLDTHKVQVTKNIEKLKANKLFAHKLDAKKLNLAKLNGGKLAPAKLDAGKLKLIKPGNAKLAFGPPVKSLKLVPAVQLAKAMPFDAMGKKYSMMKKAWWDGKHWWGGAFAWTFVGGYWYYGDELWYEDDGVWRTESGFLADCLDCGPVAVTRTRVASVSYGSGGGSSGSGSGGGSSSASAPKDKPADKATKTVSAEDAKTKTTTVMSTEAVLIKSNTAGLNGSEGESTADATTAAAPDATEPGKDVKVAEAVVEPGPSATMTDASPSEPSASPSIDCKRFVPAVSMTITVPCGK